MSEKHDLAVLYSLLGKTVAEFVESESFKRLEKETDVIKCIEPFKLPEINRLICCSAILAEQEWAKKYDEARMLYDDKNTWDVVDLLAHYNDVGVFEKKILSCVDGSILDKINAFNEKIKADKEKAKKKLIKENVQETVTGKIDVAEELDIGNVALKNSISEKPMFVTKSENELRIEKLDKDIEEKENLLRRFEKHFSKTMDYLDKLNNIEIMDEQRQKAYRVIDEIESSEEVTFLECYIHEGKLSAKDENLLRDYGFLQRLLELFDKSEYRNIAFPVLAKLYTDNAIDLECDLIARFINAHSKMLADYLEEQYSSVPEYFNDIENRAFLEYSIEHTVAGKNDYVKLWNSICKAADWKIVLDTAEEIIDDSLLKVAIKLMRQVSGTSMDTFLELLDSKEGETLRITRAEFIIELVGQEIPMQKNLVINYVRSMEQNARKLQRRVAKKEREINRHSQDLFSALYQPLEQLEQLAVNLKRSDGEIKCSLVAGHVINALADLRENLSALGLDTAADVTAWRRQLFVDYDPERHRIPSSIGKAGEQVKLQTLGFAYMDDEGNNKVRAAEVYTPALAEMYLEKTSNAKNAKSKQQKKIVKDMPSKKTKNSKSVKSTKKPKNQIYTESERKKRNDL